MKTSLESGLLKSLIWFVSLLAGGLWAQPAVGQVAPPANNRYLLIVEMSQRMEVRARGTVKAVQELLKSGMNGQIKAGDTLGVWTYDADLYTGRFPLQRWTPEGQEAITTRVMNFLRGQKREKAARLDRVLEAMEGVIKNSQLITVILVSAGDGQIRGTPFDERINEFSQRWHDKQAAARMPFVIVLRARNGEITDYTLNRPPWAVQMPYLPVETEVAAPTPSQAPEPPRVVQPPTAPPLIVSGKKSKPQPLPKSGEAAPTKPEPPAPAATAEAGKKEGPPAPPAVTEKAEAAKAEVATMKVEAPVASAAGATNASELSKVEPAKAEPPKASPPVAETAKAEAGPVAAVKAATEVPPAQPEAPRQAPAVVQLATPVADAAPKPETAKAPEPPATGSAPVPAATTPATPIQIPKPTPELLEASKPAPAPEVKAAPAPAPSATPIQIPKPAPEVLEAPKPAPEPAIKAAPAPAPTVTPIQIPKPAPEVVAAPKPAPAPEIKVAPAPAPPATPAASSVAPPPAAAAPPTQIATASPAKTPEQVAPREVTRPTSSSQESPEIRAREDTRPPSHGAEPAPLPASSTSPPAAAQTAVATPGGSTLWQRHIWLAAVALAGVMFGVAFLLLRRSRGTPHGSLITRSLDREKRP